MRIVELATAAEYGALDFSRLQLFGYMLGRRQLAIVMPKGEPTIQLSFIAPRPNGSSNRTQKLRYGQRIPLAALPRLPA
jgi:hypothetical protein